jgi:hypothetical protein
MINKLKRKKQLMVLLLLLLTFIFSHGQDTLVRKKYLDSVKNQLAIYTVTSYTHLNLYDKCENDRLKLQVEFERTKGTLDYILWRRRKENLSYGVGFLFLMGLSFFTITRFK